MKKLVFIFGLIIIFLIILFVMYRFGLIDRSQLKPGESRKIVPAVGNVAPESEVVDYDLEIVAEYLNVPWALAFTDNNRILVSERSGSIREIVGGNLNPNPIYTFDDVSSVAEEGLMGLALGPDYDTTRFVYAAYAYMGENGSMQVRVIRLVDTPDSMSFDRIIIDNIPAARFHAGGRIVFGPDNKLYVTTGDALQTTSAQNINSLSGKILRLNLDGTIPDDNPYANSPVYSLGHRNPQGLAWHPETLDLWSSEHGPSGFDGPPGGDEINLITAGMNYGWPLVSHDKEYQGTVPAKHVYTPAEAPGSLLFYSGKVFPQFEHNLFFGALRGEGLVRLIVSNNEIVLTEKLDIKVGRIRDVVESPDGLIYFTTSNTDGRGTVNQGDDKVYRLVPRD